MIPAVFLALVVATLDQAALVVGTTLPVAQPQPFVQPVIDLGYSQYEGTALSSGVNQFLGMRYAAPPLGDLRFRAPVDPLNTTGIQSATAVYSLFLIFLQAAYVFSFNPSAWA